MKKNFMLILIISLGLFVFCPSVFAYTYPVMSTKQAEYLVETLKHSTDLQNDALRYSSSDLETILNNINPELLKNQFNNLVSQSTYNISWENIILFTYFDSEGLFWNFLISNNDTNNDMGVFGISKDGNSYYRTINFSNPVKMVSFLTNTNNSLIFRGSYQDMIGLGFYTYTEPIIENDIITNLDRFICFNKNYYTKWNRESDYYFKNKVIFNNDGTTSIPSDSDSSSGDVGTYYNYDYNEYFIRPYIKIETINGLTQYLADSYTIPFSVYSQSGDEYYPFDSLKMDLRVLKSVTDYSGDNLETHFVSMVDSYKRFSGNFADTTGFSDFVTNGNILRYNYNLKDKFDSTFVNQFLNDATNKEQYAFQLVLYDFWGDVLSMSDVFYFYDTNNLNNKPLIDNWGGDNTINSSFDSTNTTDFSSLVKTFTDFMSTIMSFWSFLPGWLITLLTLGVTSAIAIRILGR